MNPYAWRQAFFLNFPADVLIARFSVGQMY